MTEAEKLSMLNTILRADAEGGTDDSLLMVYLDAAKRELLGWRYSYSDKKPQDVPEEYEITQIFAVLAGLNQSGAENQQTHTENGISRSFSHADMVEYIRSTVVPICRVI